MVKVHSIVHYLHQENDFVVQHEHDCFECVFYVKGKVAVSTNREISTFNAPGIAITSPHVYHDEKEMTESEMYILLFEDSTRSNIPFIYVELNKEEKEKVLSLIKNIYDNYSNSKNEEIINSTFALLLTLFIDNKTNLNRDTFRINLVNNLKDYLASNLSEKIDIFEICSRCGYSYSRLRHIFKEDTGVSFHRYLLNCRLIRAKQLLMDSDMLIKDIAYECGFNSMSQFDIFFSKELGLSPNDFRKKNKNKNDIGVFSTKKDGNNV